MVGDDAPSDALRDVYERRAELVYRRPGVGLPPARDRKFERVWALVEGVLPCEHFLDAGCGDGRHLSAFAAVEPRPRLTGVDIAERILVTARAALDEAGVEAELVRANVEQLPFPDGSFDVVLCTQVVEHLLDPEAGVRELARVLRPGGALIVTTDNRRTLSRVLNAPRSLAVRTLGLAGRRREVVFPHRDFIVGEFAALIARAGLAVEHIETFRFHFRAPLNRGPVQAALDALDRRLPAHRLGDIVAVVARRPQ